MKKSKGFTLRELLLVIGLIIVLVIVFMPGGRGHREERLRANCSSTLSAIDKACYLYASDHLEKYPFGWKHSNDGSDGWTIGDEVTPQDSFALLVHEGFIDTAQLICPGVGGEPAANEWELVGLGGRYNGDPAAAAEAFMHYAYQDVGVGDGKNYVAGAGLQWSMPILADRGVRKDTKHGNYKLTGEGSANHPMEPGCQNVVAAHGVSTHFSDANGKCLVGYSDGVLGDNIYTDAMGKNDTYLLSSKAQAGQSD